MSLDNDAINVCNPLNLEDEELNNNCVVFSLKIKDVLYSDDNCINDENESMSLDADLDNDYMLYGIEVVPPELSCYIVDSEGKNIIHYGSTTRKPVETIIDRDNDENHVHMKPGYLCCVSSRKVDFFLDSGAAHHICRDRFCLQNFKRLPEEDCVNLFSADGETFAAQHKGDLIYHNIKLHNVLFTRKTGFNVISVAELDRQGLMTCIGGGQFSIYNVQESKVVAQGYLDEENNDYLFSAMDWCLPKEAINEMALVEGEQQQGAVEGDEREEWVIDSLCARHMVPTRSMIPDMVPENLTFRSATGTIRVEGKGQVTNDNITLSDVLYSPDIHHNLMSVAQLDKKGYLFTFFKGRCQIQIRETLEDRGYGTLDYTMNWYILKDFKERTNSDQAPLEGQKRGKKRRRSK